MHNNGCLITQNVSSSQLFRVISGLEKASNYSVVVSSFSPRETFHSKARVVQTDEDGSLKNVASAVCVAVLKCFKCIVQLVSFTQTLNTNNL